MHMVRHSLNYVSWKRREQGATDLKRIYQSTTAEEVETKFAEFEQKWNAAYPPIAQSWRRNWPRIIPFFDYPPEIRKVIYTTDEINKPSVIAEINLPSHCV